MDDLCESKSSEILLVNNTGADIDVFDHALRLAALTGELSEEISDIFSLRVVASPWSVGANSGSLRAIVEWA